jgi:UDP-N-acetylmuramate--alanine ligase
MQEFARSFNNADVLFITDIYAASEDPIEGVTAEALTAAIKRFGHKDVNYIGSLDNAAPALVERIQPGDLVLTLGAGTVNRVSEQLLFLLREQSQDLNDGRSK